jgi:DNA-binding MarR family transcriptional regulator
MSKQKNDAAVHTVAAEVRIVVGKLSRRLREQTQLGDFTYSQLKVLVRLETDGPATVTTLAREEGVRPQSMGEIIAVLKTAGLIGGAPDPNDGRQTVLSLTDTCRDLMKRTRAAKEDWLFQTITSRFEPAEIEQLAASVAMIKRLLDE